VVLDGGYELSDSCGISDVDGLVEDFAASGLMNIGGGPFELRCGASANGDAGAFASEFFGDGAAQSLTGGRNDSYAAR
jgi:hypothetical protein